jgi:hypothetical protein
LTTARPLSQRPWCSSEHQGLCDSSVHVGFVGLAELSARARVFATVQGRKTDATDAHTVTHVDRRQAEGEGLIVANIYPQSGLELQTPGPVDEVWHERL